MRSRFGLVVLVWLLTAGATSLLAGCQHVQPEKQIEYRTATVAVSAPCVVDPPQRVTPLNQQMTPDQWNARAPGAKAEAVKAQAGDRLNYEDRQAASTSGCPVVHTGGNTGNLPSASSGAAGTVPVDLLPPGQQ